MEMTLITDFAQSFDEGDILHCLSMPRDHAFGENIRELLAKTKEIARPKAFYMVCPIEEKGDATVTVGGQTFRSVALAKKLADVDVIYPYMSTCGKELADFGLTLTDMLEKFAFDAVMEYYRRQIDASLAARLDDLVPEGMHASKSNPGSLTGWPIQEQKKLFALFGDAAAAVGVELNENYLMFPVKSVSGIAYATKGVSQDCELCQRSNCPNRKAAFNMKAYLEATGH